MKEVGYDTFMKMTEKEQIGQVQIDQEENEILFTDKDGTEIYKTGMVEDPGMTERLYNSGAEFSGQIIKQMSPILSIILSWILPIVIFIGLGQYMSRKLMNKASGGPNSMIFGMGKSNAKVYVKSSEGIRFSDVAGEDEAKENLSEIVDYLHNPGNTGRSERPCRRASFSWGLPEQARPCLPRRLPASRMCRSLDVRFGICRNVRGHGRVQSSRPV